MPDIPDLELLRTEDPIEPPPSKAPKGVLIAVALLVIAAAVAAYIVYGRKTASAPPPAAAQSAPQPARPLGGEAEKVTVPPLDQTDALVSELVGKISSHPKVLAWLTTDGLIRNFTVVVANIGDGTTPARHLKVLQPQGPFQVVERNGEAFIDTRSYERYDPLAAAAASIDPAGASSLYATLKPRINEAYRELGVQPPSFDAALERAIVTLLQTPIVDGPVRVEPKGIGYRYADPKLERLTAAQKQLLRTGPRNVRTIQDALRRIAVSLGIPRDRLP
jgi:hypothetical protein